MLVRGLREAINIAIAAVQVEMGRAEGLAASLTDG
jgi:hypothetical protein